MIRLDKLSSFANSLHDRQAEAGTWQKADSLGAFWTVQMA